jgi:hypothetical protein
MFMFMLMSMLLLVFLAVLFVDGVGASAPVSEQSMHFYTDVKKNVMWGCTVWEREVKVTEGGIGELWCVYYLNLVG